jgi:hypothetical protein
VRESAAIEELIESHDHRSSGLSRSRSARW